MERQRNKRNTKAARSAAILLLCMTILAYLSQPGAGAEGTSVLKGVVLDSKGKAVEGAEIYIYRRPVTIGPADFMSSKTGKDGAVSVTLPAGNYWAVARAKKKAEAGPPMPGDKFSFEVMELEITAGGEVRKEFIVGDMREVARAMKKVKKELVKIEGRIIDKRGAAVEMAYVFADTRTSVPMFPYYMSAWTDEDGHFSLYVPGGKYCVGAASAFPLPQGAVKCRETVFKTDRPDFDVIIGSEIK